MRNLLFVSIAFPPKLDPECIQIAKYLKHLAIQSNGYNIDVITSKSPTLFMPFDSSLVQDKNKFRQQIELKIWENKYVSFLLNKFKFGYSQFPDSKFSFHLQWKKAVKKLLHKPEIIYSRSFPLSSTIMAYKLATHFNVPWVLHLSDPWVDSPLHNYSAKEKEKHSFWEKESFKKANYICFTSEGTINLYKKKYPAFTTKFKLFPNVYDKDDAAIKSPLLFDKLRFVYTGGLAGSRSPEVLLKAILSLKEEYLKECEFIFAGDIDRKNTLLFQKYSHKSITHMGALSFKIALELQKTAHVLLVIDSDLKVNSSSVFFPSKLLDYLAVGNRILAITPQNSTTENFILKYKLGNAVEHKKSVDLTNHINMCFIEFNKKNSNYFQLNKSIEEYEAQYNVKRLLNLFNEAL